MLSTFNLVGGPGGGTYGGVSSPFQGGSAGGFGSASAANAGAGGGAIELGQGNLQLLGATIIANGGNGGATGGGGSGGNISILGSSVSLLGTQLFTMGGNGGAGASWGGQAPGSDGAGGGGGGGIIDIAGPLVATYSQYYVNGGTGYANGEDGSIFQSSVPEPSSFVLAAIACMAGLSYRLITSRCRGR